MSTLSIVYCVGVFVLYTAYIFMHLYYKNKVEELPLFSETYASYNMALMLGSWVTILSIAGVYVHRYFKTKRQNNG